MKLRNLIAKYIYYIRTSRRDSQSKAGRQAGLSQSTVSDMEGAYGITPKSLEPYIEKYLKMSTEDFLRGLIQFMGQDK